MIWNRKAPPQQIIVVLVLIMLLVFSAGCWDRRELNRRAIVSGLAFDAGTQEKQLLLTAQIINPTALKSSSNGGGGGDPFWLVESQGETVLEALRNFTHLSPRKLFLPHNQVIIFGAELAQNGIKDYMDFLQRDYEFRESNWIIVSEVKAGDILASKTTNSISAFFINNLVEERFSNSKAMGISLADFSKASMSKSTTPVASLISFQPQGNEKLLTLSGTAVFNQELKMVGKLNDKESRGLLWVLGQVKQGIIVIAAPDRQAKCSLEIIAASSKIIPSFKEDQPKITVKIKVNSNLGETTSTFDLMKPENWKAMQSSQEEVIQQEVMMALNKAQELGTDYFGFGDSIYKKFPRQWKAIEPRWQELFPDLEVEIVVDSTVSKPGLIITNLLGSKGDG